MYDKAEEAGGTFFLPSLCRGGSWTKPTDPPWDWARLPPIVAAPRGRELSGVILVMTTSLNSIRPALISASSGACLRIAAHFHSTTMSFHFTGKETEADAVEGEPEV